MLVSVSYSFVVRHHIPLQESFHDPPRIDILYLISCIALHVLLVDVNHRLYKTNINKMHINIYIHYRSKRSFFILKEKEKVKRREKKKTRFIYQKKGCQTNLPVFIK